MRLFRIFFFLLVATGLILAGCSSGPSFCDCFGGNPLDKSPSLVEKCQKKFKNTSPAEITKRLMDGECK